MNVISSWQFDNWIASTLCKHWYLLFFIWYRFSIWYRREYWQKMLTVMSVQCSCSVLFIPNHTFHTPFSTQRLGHRCLYINFDPQNCILIISIQFFFKWDVREHWCNVIFQSELHHVYQIWDVWRNMCYLYILQKSGAFILISTTV